MFEKIRKRIKEANKQFVDNFNHLQDIDNRKWTIRDNGDFVMYDKRSDIDFVVNPEHVKRYVWVGEEYLEVK